RRRPRARRDPSSRQPPGPARPGRCRGASAPRRPARRGFGSPARGQSGGKPKKLPDFGANAKIIGAAPDGTLLWSRVGDLYAKVDDATFTMARSDARGSAPAPFW